MRQIKDIEQILDDIITFLISDLNCQIAKINTEKSDSIVLDTVPDTSYYIDLAEIPEDKIFVDIVLDDTINLDPNSIGRAATELNVVVSIWFTLKDAGNNNNAYRKGLRYGDALLRVCGNRSSNSVDFGYTMTALLPVRRNFDNGAQVVGSGIQLNYKFA